MNSAAVYCRVSTDNQEREGTSLQTQLENCLKYCQDKGYNVSYRFNETYSGLSLERPELDKIRELVRNEEIDSIVCYSLDRLSRDHGHGVIITQELEKHGVKLETVTEDVDNSELGKLISYIRGYASKVEAEKIRERTMRGKKARAKDGRMPMGSGIGLYGYDYMPVSQKGGGQRVINEIEAAWVRKMFEWLVDEGLTTTAITFRLRALNAPTKSGKIWSRRSVHERLTNIAYTGKTYVFTDSDGKVFGKPKEEWIELPGFTPAIISIELFEAAQKQLKMNYDKSKRNCKHEYLLGGHLRCAKCGYAFVGHPIGGKRYYHCSHTMKINAPVERCKNAMWNAEKLETMVWAELENYLGDRDIVRGNMEKQRQNLGQLNAFETELKQTDHQLKSINHEQHQLLQWALKDFPADQVEAENKRLNKSKETLNVQKNELEERIKASQSAVVNVPNLERFIKDLQDKLPSLDFAGKRLALDMLGTTVYIDDQNVEIIGTIEPDSNPSIVSQSSRCSCSGNYFVLTDLQRFLLLGSCT
jgi:site-specific DNA recombinase